MCSRRTVLLGGALLLCEFPVIAKASDASGCIISDDDVKRHVDHGAVPFSFDIDSGPLFGGSGNKPLDRALAVTLAKISDKFSILPGFAFFDDSDGMNAFASPSKRLQRADGSVVFGKGLLQRVLSEPESPEAGVAAVCAHEFGHIVQFKLGLQNQLVGADGHVKRLELHADFLAGYFAGVRKMENPSFPAAVFAQTQYHFGDNQIQNPQHHGTPNERAAAVVKGFGVAKDKKPLADSVQLGVNYVLSI